MTRTPAAVPPFPERMEGEPSVNQASTAGPRQGHTPGPWRWEVNRASKSIKLCGGPPNKGFGRYDLTVMEFCRYGMNKAAPVFWDWCSKRFVGTPHRADALAVTVEGREHHASWFADIDHPDARLIAAAPELLEALELAVSYGWQHPSALDAIAKARLSITREPQEG